MYTLGTTPKTICKIEESYSINIGVVSSAVFQRGQVVKLSSTGEAEPIEALTDKPLGMIVAGNTTAGEEVTVQTEFNALVRCKASGAIAIGDEVAVQEIETTGEKLTVVKKAVATNYIVGVALSAGATTESVQIGFNRVSLLKA